MSQLLGHPTRLGLYALLAAASLCVAATSGAAGEPARLSLECATRDLALVTLIERYGEARIVTSETLASAYFTVMRARSACSENRVTDGLEAYDRVFEVLSDAAVPADVTARRTLPRDP